MLNISSRTLISLCLLICIASLIGAAYLQYVEGLQPCPLCILQRIVFIGLTLWLIIAFLHHPSKGGARVYGIGIILLSAVGAGIAARQVWLQHLPPEAQPECGPGFDFLMQNFPVHDALNYIFAGSGECATIDWTFLGQGLAMWSMILFVVLFIAGWVLTLQKNK